MEQKSDEVVIAKFATATKHGAMSGSQLVHNFRTTSRKRIRGVADA